jgi:hypothetical protein
MFANQVMNGQTIRYPATANLLIDSEDRTNGSSGNFSLVRNNSILNGFFNRIGTTEVVLNWTVPNIATSYNNSLQGIDVSGVGVSSYQIPDGSYTVQEAISTWIALVNAAAPGGNVLSVASAGVICTITGSVAFRFPVAGGFLGDIGFSQGGAYSLTQSCTTTTSFNLALNVGLPAYKFIDFVCPQLTINQDLKDGSTNLRTPDVLCRFYFAFDTDTPIVDGLGFPIYFGMKPQTVRRIFSPPKQIMWNNTQPLGNLTFQVYGVVADGPNENVNPVLLENLDFEWMMTLQASEN